MEDYAYILDYLPNGSHHESRRLKREPIAYALGRDQFKLFELAPKENAPLTIGDEVYIGKEVSLRDQILHVKRRVRYDELSTAAQRELPYIVEQIVQAREADFVRFYNEARSITARFHMLELLPGLGKKSMWSVIEERKKKPFESFRDIADRIGSIHHPEKLIAKRIEIELSEPDQKYHLIVAK